MAKPDSAANTGYIIRLTFVVALGGLLFGYDTAVISGTVSALEDFFIHPRGLQGDEASSLLGVTVSCALLGCIIGGACAGWLSHRFGRKRILIVSAGLFCLSALGSAVPEIGIQEIGSQDAYKTLNAFIVYRIIGGIGVGMASMLAPMYIAEIAPANSRGKLVSFNQLAIVTGIIVVYFVNYIIARQGDIEWLNTLGWRYMFASEIVPAVAFFCLLFAIPESPRWLVLRGRDDMAMSVLTSLHGKEIAKREFREVSESIGQHSGRLFSYGVLVLIIGVALSVFQQFVGINVVLYYAPEIFKKMGAGVNAAMWQTVIVGTVNLVCTFIAIATVDRFGRKPLMIFGALGMAVAMIALGLCFSTQNMGLLSLTMMLFYVGCFSLSWGPVCWVLLSEIFPNNIRSKALAMAVAAQWIANYIVSWSFPILDNNTVLVEKFNHGFAYWLYGLMAILAAWMVWKMVPETKGKSLEEIEQVWLKSPG